MPDPSDKSPKTWNVGGKPMMRSEDYQQQKAAEMEAAGVHLGEVTQRYIQAQAEYFEALRAIPHGDIAAVQAAPAQYSPAAGAGGVAAPQAADELTDHNYDGIQEYDNPIPGWWNWVFYGCIVYSFFHVALVHFTPDSVWKLPEQRHAVTEAAALEKQFAELNKIPMGEAKILQIMSKDEWLEEGRAIFTATCALCHGQNGEGLVGPNLTDEVYKTENITSLIDMANIIVTGAAKGAMPSQKNVLNENEIALVAAYVASMRGQNLEGPRGAEGDEIAPWPTLDEAGEVVPSGEMSSTLPAGSVNPSIASADD